MQPGDVPATWANAALITALVGALPQTDIRDGAARFVDWYRGWNGNCPPTPHACRQPES